jgi:glycerophosphoryl diester phosphodiesterase
MRTNAKVWEHRGCRGARNPPENSLGAFREAIRQGASGIELDLFLSTDDELVVFHDETIERMTNGTGHVTSFAVEELKELRLKDVHGHLTKEEIPTLDEVFALVDACRSQLRQSISGAQRAEQFVVNIEIKGSGIASHVEKAVQRRLGTGWKYRNFLVSSFDIGTLEELRNLNPDIPVGALFEGPLGSPREPWDLQLDELERCLAKSRNLHPQTVNITLPSLTNDAVAAIRAVGATPVAWTCNEAPPDTLRGQSRHGLAEQICENDITLITDYPAQMIELLISSC